MPRKLVASSRSSRRGDHARSGRPRRRGIFRSHQTLALLALGSPAVERDHAQERANDSRGGGRDERPARGSLRCVRSFRCAARRESGFSTGCGAAGASSAACYLADDATGWSGGVSIPTSMTIEHDEPSCLIAASRTPSSDPVKPLGGRRRPSRPYRAAVGMMVKLSAK
jgi:hypothetical protein